MYRIYLSRVILQPMYLYISPRTYNPPECPTANQTCNAVKENHFLTRNTSSHRDIFLHLDSSATCSELLTSRILSIALFPCKEIGCFVNLLPLLGGMSNDPQSLSGIDAAGKAAKKGLAWGSARTSERGERNSRFK